MRETIIRLVALVIVLANQICVSKGWWGFEIAEDQTYELVSMMATIIVSAWTFWKNNSFSKNAKLADEYLTQLNEKK